MVPITQGDKVFGEQKLRVTAPTGEYGDFDLIECADPASTESTGAFQAQYVKYGPMVYQFTTPEELGAAIAAMDPESTHDAAQLWREDEARRIKRMGGTLIPEDQTAAPDAIDPAAIPEEEEEDVKFFKEKEEEESASSTPQLPEEPPQDRDIPVIEMEEPPLGEVEGAASTTPPAPEPVPEPTPEPVPEIPVIQIEEPPAVPELPVDPVPLDTSSTTPQ